MARVSAATVVSASLLCAGAAGLPHESSPGFCKDPPTGASGRMRKHYCTRCYLDTLAKLTQLNGSDLVIGANDGISFDPANFFGYWNQVSHHKVGWVEPNPLLFKQLAKNVAGIPNKVLLNLAASSTGGGGPLSLICFNSTTVDAVLEGRIADPLMPYGHRITPAFNALCSVSIDAIMEASDVLKGGKPTPTGHAPVIDVVKRLLVVYDVPSKSVTELVEDAGLADVRYLQIDVEGLDNEIIKSLPLGENGFAPDMIMYENHNGLSVAPQLQQHGYHTCCCMDKWGSNIVAVKVNGDTARIPQPAHEVKFMDNTLAHAVFHGQ